MAIFTMAKNSLFFQQTDWEYILYSEYSKPYFKKLEDELEKRASQGIRICPRPERVFHAFTETPYNRTRVVFVGQDPYPNYTMAEGLAFSVPSITSESKIPGSLKNIFRELRRDINISPKVKLNPHLGSWAEQGVLLLNTVLTTEEGKPGAHAGLGWERFTDRIIQELNSRHEPVVFVLFGAQAGRVKKYINPENHGIIEVAHPSPQSAHRGFYFSKLFSRVNEELQQRGSQQIYWESICYKRY